MVNFNKFTAKKSTTTPAINSNVRIIQIFLIIPFWFAIASILGASAKFNTRYVYSLVFFIVPFIWALPAHCVEENEQNDDDIYKDRDDNEFFQFIPSEENLVPDPACLRFGTKRQFEGENDDDNLTIKKARNDDVEDDDDDFSLATATVQGCGCGCGGDAADAAESDFESEEYEEEKGPDLDLSLKL